MSRLPPMVKVWSLILVVTAGYGWMGQMLPGSQIDPPPSSSPSPPPREPGPDPPVALAGTGTGTTLPAGFENGRELYQRTCVLCHGEQGEGREALNAPRLAGQDAWYIERQLANFVSGVRGSDPQDVFGMQMRPMAMSLGEAEVENVAAYIATLE